MGHGKDWNPVVKMILFATVFNFNENNGLAVAKYVAELSDENPVLDVGYRSVAKHTFSHQYA